MAKGQGGGGPQRPLRGFRPGREPAQLRKQRARQQLGGEANWAQKQLIDALSDRSPREARTMLQRWQRVLLVAAIVTAVAGALLYMWSVVAGILVHLLAIAAFLLWFQLRRNRANFEAMADLVGDRRGGRGERGESSGRRQGTAGGPKAAGSKPGRPRRGRSEG